MTLDTKYFGPVEYEEDDLLVFQKGMFGFEEEHSFLLIPFAPGDGSLLCLQSTATPALAFIVMDPFSLLQDYSPVLTEEELKSLGVSDSEDLGYYVMCVVKKPVAESTVNLQCPLAVSPRTRSARQVILESSDYHMRHLLSEFGPRGGGASC